MNFINLKKLSLNSASLFGIASFFNLSASLAKNEIDIRGYDLHSSSGSLTKILLSILKEPSAEAGGTEKCHSKSHSKSEGSGKIGPAGGGGSYSKSYSKESICK